jgi:hypothetical protein
MLPLPLPLGYILTTSAALLSDPSPIKPGLNEFGYVGFL